MVRKRGRAGQRLCNVCGVSKTTLLGRNEFGEKIYRSRCYGCHSKPYTRYKKSKCEMCGFIPIHRVQLDVDHIDGNRDNNSIENLMTLCANCHRIKTYLNQDRIKLK